MITRRTLRGVAAAAVLATTLAACSSGGGAQSSQGGAGAPPEGEQFTIAMVTHEQEGDTFWDKIRAGAEDAAAQHGMELKYSQNQNGPEQATLVQNAIDSQVDGIAVTLANVDAVVPVTQKAVAAGIPVVAFNQGYDEFTEAGALMYFGSDELLAGQTIGEKITEDGGGKALCVIQAQGLVALETRCAGVKEKFASTEVLYVNGADLPAVQATIGSKLTQDPSITHIVTLGAQIAMAAIQSQADTGNTAKLITFDLNKDAAKAIQEGKIQFSVDQQPYVQGFMAVEGLWLNLTNGNDLGGGQPVRTGPSIVDSENIDVILPYTENNTR